MNQVNKAYSEKDYIDSELKHLTQQKGALELQLKEFHDKYEKKKAELESVEDEIRFEREKEEEA